MNRKRYSDIVRPASFVLLTLALVAVAVGALAFGSTVSAQDEATSGGYIYTVQTGDSWSTVATETGVTVEALKAANPDALRENEWLLENEKLVIPISAASVDAEGVQEHEVQSGESWNSIAEQYGITVQVLQAANPRSIRSGQILYRGERLLIPPPTSEAPGDFSLPPEIGDEPDATAEDASTDEDAAEGEPADDTEETPSTDAAELAASEEVTATDSVSDTAQSTGDQAEGGQTESEDAAAETDPEDSLPECPADFADYAEVLTTLINASEGGVQALSDFLTQCEVAVADAFLVTDLTGDGVDDVAFVYTNPNAESAFVESDLLIYTASADGFELGHRARAAGDVRLLANEDINLDGQIDVVWIDTTCGASTCFDTVNVRSWDGTTWHDWTDGTITMAYAEIDLEDTLDEGQGAEVVMSGGIYGSVGAGPQRGRTETWISQEGAPYALYTKEYNESECLYHTVLDANRAFLDASPEEYDEAKALYEKAASDETLIKCWVRDNELEELRGFSLFRLAVIAGYEEDASEAGDRIAELNATYADSVYDQVGQNWLETYIDTGDAGAACEAANEFANDNPEVWEVLADYGYTNPSFEADDVCPVFDLDVAADADTDDAEAANTADEATSDEEGEAASDESEDTSATEEEDADASADEAETDETESSEEASEEAGETEAEATGSAQSSECPQDLAGYAEVLPEVLATTGADQAALEAWLTSCDAMNEDRGAVVVADLDDDGDDDVVLFPTIVSDLGFGPDGAQGAVLIYHATDDGSYELVDTPEVYGAPAPLAFEDLNNDGKTELAWQVEGCSTFCVMEVQMQVWDGSAYVDAIQPGATIAEGIAYFEPADDTDDGQVLVLSGGVSGSPEGGLEVPHEEVWASVDGAPYQRVSWTYDRAAEGADCLSLRLVEADMALQAAPTAGYDAAIELYTAALDPALAACSIYGFAEEDELVLLQGLGSFRLIQAQALSGEDEAAQVTLEGLAAGQPDAMYTEAANQWLTVYESSEDGSVACAAVQPLFNSNDDLWQITDHYGYNHPALAAEQICFVP